MLTSKQRTALSGLAQKLPDLIQLGRSGPSPALVAQLGRLLADHELVKLRFVDFKATRDEVARGLAAGTGSELVRVIGNTAIFWKRSPDPEKQKVQLP